MAQNSFLKINFVKHTRLALLRANLSADHTLVTDFALGQEENSLQRLSYTYHYQVIWKVICLSLTMAIKVMLTYIQLEYM